MLTNNDPYNTMKICVLKASESFEYKDERYIIEYKEFHPPIQLGGNIAASRLFVFEERSQEIIWSEFYMTTLTIKQVKNAIRKIKKEHESIIAFPGK